MPDQDKMTIVAASTSKSGMRNSDGNVQKLVEKAVDVTTLQANFTEFLCQLRQILVVDSGRVGNLVLDEITFSVEIGVDGQFKLLGTGIGANASSSLTFTLRRDDIG